jgi:hypothetical protein
MTLGLLDEMVSLALFILAGLEPRSSQSLSYNFYFKKENVTRLMPVVLATQKAEIRRI